MRVITTLLASLTIAGFASAASISFTFTPPTPKTDTGQQPCGTKLFYYCDTTAYFDTDSLSTDNPDGVSQLFNTAFGNWNETYGGDIWQLYSGGSLTGSFDISTADALEDPTNSLGGVEIQVGVGEVDLPPYTPAAGESLVWVQALYTNYDYGSGDIVQPKYILDVGDCNGNPVGNLTDPQYPCDGGGLNFGDKPEASYQNFGTPQAFLFANTYLAVENTENPAAPTLTVYDGVCYGFQNYVSSSQSTTVPSLQPAPGVCSAEETASPEPDAAGLCLSGMIGILLIARKKVRVLRP